MTLDDIVNAMIDLDQNEIVTNFGARDILILPKGDHKDLDSYTLLERLMVLEEKCRRMENGLNENVAEVIMQKEFIKDVIDIMRTHDTLLHERLAPTTPTYAYLAAGRQSIGDGGENPGGSNGTRPGTLEQYSKPTDNNSKKHASVQQQNNGGPKRLV